MEVYVMMTICNRKNMQSFVDFYNDNNIKTGNISFGLGTASSDVLNYLGLEDDEKGIFSALVTAGTWNSIKRKLITDMRIDVPGTGIVFLMPLSSIGGKKTLGFLIDGQEYERGTEESSMKDTKHELIVTIANYGYNTLVMHAAESAGAAGGTVLHGKGVGMKGAQQFLGVSLISEKEVILIVAKSEKKKAIMQAIMEQAGPPAKAGAVCFSLPVSATLGLRHVEDEIAKVDEQSDVAETSAATEG